VTGNTSVGDDGTAELSYPHSISCVDIDSRHHAISRCMISRPMQNENTPHQDLYSGLIRLHILHHACQNEIFGLEMIEELGRHGYKLSPGTMYPILHSLEDRGLLVSKEKQEGRRHRRFYRATPAGRRALVAAKEKVRELFGELFGELFEHQPHRASRKRTQPRRTKPQT
jgi:PadR family transcriptional regulator, regulatory protein PadR